MLPEQLGAHIPWGRFDAHIDLVLSLGLAPEIAIKGPELDQLDPQRLACAAATLAKHDLRPTVHAPFFDLNPGALDPLVRGITMERLSQALAFSAALNARIMVVHPGFDRWRYPNLEETWSELACLFFPPLLEQACACDCRLAIENIYEQTPQTLAGLVERLDSPWLGHCFDAGHWQLFGETSMQAWLATITPKLYHLHLHDNHGLADEHLPVGEGTIDFSPLRAALEAMATPPSITLEAHEPAHLQRSLRAVQILFGK